MRGTTKLILLLVLIFIIIGILGRSLGLGGKTTTTTTSNTSNNSAPKTYSIEYRITGTAERVDVTLSNETGGTEQFDNKRVPYSMEFEAVEGAFLYISAQNQDDRGTVKCSILVEGIEVREAESSGAYVIASCSGKL